MITLNPEVQLGTFIENQFGESYLFSVNGNTLQKLSYASLIAPLFDEEMNEANTLYLIVGSDSGLMPYYLQKNPLKQGSTALFIDFQEVNQIARQQYDLSEEKRIAVSNTENWAAQAEKFNIKQYFLLNKVTIIRSLSVQYHFLNDYQHLFKELSNYINLKSWEVVANLTSTVFIKNRLSNLSENNQPVIRLKNSFAGKQILILAAGPSLDDHIEWIEKNQQHYIVFALSRITKRLLNTSIKPDFILSIDPHAENFEISKEIFSFSNSCTLIYFNHLNSQLLGQWPGNKYFIERHYPWDSDRQIENISANGPTVTNTSIDIALLMGAKKIILLGVDLCFSPQGYTHVSDSIERLSGPPVSFTAQTVITNLGNTAETTSDFFSATQRLEQQAALAKQINHCQLINPSADAACIKGIDFIYSKNIIPPETITASQKLIKSNQPDSEDYKQQRQLLIKHNEDILTELTMVLHHLDTIQSMAEKGINYNKKFFSNNDPKANYHNKIKMDKLEKKLRKAPLKTFTDLCIQFGIEEFLTFIQPDNDKQWTHQQIQEAGHVYYSALASGTGKIEKEIKTAMHRTRCRLFEVDPENKQCKQMTIELLIKQWKNDLQPHRIQQIKYLHPDLYASFPEHSIIEMENSFKLEMESDLFQSSKYNKTNNFAALDGIDTKAYDLFNHGDISALERLLNALKLRDDQEIESVIHLVQAYIYDLEGDIVKALAEYLQADSTLTLESALKRVVSITLAQKNHESAVVGLQTLSQVSPLYMPQLAELQHILGHNKDALNTYADYLDLNPADINVMSKLGLLYIELDILDGADFVFKHILEQEPNNQIAQQYLHKK